MREVRRVLKPGGRFHMVDFGGPGSRKRGFLAHMIHADRHLKDNAEDRVLALMRDAGLEDAQVLALRPSPLGSAVYYQAAVPPA